VIASSLISLPLNLPNKPILSPITHKRDRKNKPSIAISSTTGLWSGVSKSTPTALRRKESPQEQANKEYRT
jgi:hypothetical protein